MIDWTVLLKIIQKPDVLCWMNVKEDLAMIPYPLLCTTSMIVEVIEPSWYSALFFFQGLLLEILVLNILYSGLYIFVIALLSL